LKQLTLSACALCQDKSELELSHIIPKFVLRYLKETSAGFLRSAENPNTVVQDGEKHYMLCGKCEDLFSKYEKKFADNIFHAYFKNNQRRFEYDTWLHYFLTSVSWRHLYLDLLDFVENHIVGLDALECLITSEQIMRDYLLNKRNDIGNIEHHIFFFEDIESISDELKKLQPHVSVHRSVGGYTAANEETKTYYTFTNMMGILVFTLYSKGEKEVWKNTQIFNGMGVIEAKNQYIASVCGQEIKELMESSKRSQEQLSDNQQRKILERLKKVSNNIENYPVFDDFKKDREL
jgi:hypothetical protein